MARFNPSEYQDVNERIPKFYTAIKGGSILTEILEHTEEYVVVKASLLDDGRNIRSTGLAQEFRVFEKATTSTGDTYEPVNMFNYIENAETSAIGRALANLGFSGSKRPSKQEMEKVDRMEGSRPQVSARPSQEQLKFINTMLENKGIALEDRKSLVMMIIGKDSTEMTKLEASKLLDELTKTSSDILQNMVKGEPF